MAKAGSERVVLETDFINYEWIKISKVVIFDITHYSCCTNVAWDQVMQSCLILSVVTKHDFIAS